MSRLTSQPTYPEGRGVLDLTATSIYNVFETRPCALVLVYTINTGWDSLCTRRDRADLTAGAFVMLPWSFTTSTINMLCVARTYLVLVLGIRA